MSDFVPERLFVIQGIFKKYRHWLLGLGVLSTLVGLFFLVFTTTGTLTAVYIFSGFMIFAGALQIIGAVRLFVGASGVLWGVFGVLYILAGYFGFTEPFKAAAALTFILGLFLVLAGIIRIFTAWHLRPITGWTWVLISGVITLLIGVIMLLSTNAALWVLGTLLGIDFICQGLNFLVLAGLFSLKAV